MVPLAVGRTKSVRLIEDAVQSEKPIAILTQKNPDEDDPSVDDLYHVGTVARILKVVKIASDNYSVIIQGQSRIRLSELHQEEPFFSGDFDHLDEEELAGTDQVENRKRCS